MTPETLALVLGILGAIFAILANVAGLLEKTIGILEGIQDWKKREDKGFPGKFEGEDAYENVWRSDHSLHEKIKTTRKLLLTHLHDLIYLDCHVDIEIDNDYNATIVFNVEALNLSKKSVSGDMWKLWFESPTQNVDIHARDSKTKNELPVSLWRDLGNFKQVYVEFEVPIKREEKTSYSFEYFAPEMFRDGLWWEQEIPRLTNRACVRIVLPAGVDSGKVRVKDCGPSGEILELESGIDKKWTDDKKRVIVWKKEFPKIGHLYRIEWEKKYNL